MSFRMTSFGTPGAMVPGTINKPQRGSFVKSSSSLLPPATVESSYLYYTDNKWTVGDDKVRIGSGAGQSNQGEASVAIGPYAGQSNQQTQSVARGN